MADAPLAGVHQDVGPPDEQGSRHIYVVFSGLVLVMLLAALDSTIVSTALPTIVGELGGFDHISWVVTAYLLAQTIVTPLYGKLGAGTPGSVYSPSAGKRQGRGGDKNGC